MNYLPNNKVTQLINDYQYGKIKQFDDHSPDAEVYNNIPAYYRWVVKYLNDRYEHEKHIFYEDYSKFYFSILNTIPFSVHVSFMEISEDTLSKAMTDLFELIISDYEKNNKKYYNYCTLF